MKSFILLLCLGFSVSVLAKEPGLPYEPDTTKIKLEKLSKTNTVQLNFRMKMPGNQGLNKAAPSFVAVYEKSGKAEWKETKRIDLKAYSLFGSDLNFSESIQLGSKDSDVAVFSTIFHCDKDTKKYCYIQGFQGITQRSAKASNQTMNFAIEPKMK